ncbi:gliding motility-associated-like protein [Flavobacterium nitrogenifigens]|uniref:Gliding motility-associated-like protein n=2 Tax=Flavobacterium TaxID=237 RepID=A0A7W7IYP6_9FLAO|nr:MULTISPECIES: gliding motility-associated C-terminal domain-containing protein [Flavobacterium]MBB4803039.1 gliding motility-associated-like protein [Flavobacterium nitrogenifigens]MBB6387997.1 gliding motility-associated-like protein [Flavobacterium notoginsengisoli]
MAKNYINLLRFIILFIFLNFFSSKINAQCAGTDGQKVICDIENPVNESLSLFSLLGGSPVPGGTWSDNNNLKGLDPATGILHPQLITKGGVYQYTYTAPSTAGCTNNKAVVTITIGAFPGVGSQATVCNDSNYFNLFTAFDSNSMGPHSNGQWRNSEGKVIEPSLYIGDIDKKTTLQFTYTVPPVLECSPASKSTTVTVTVLRAPKPGDTQNLILCGTTGLAAYTNLDLNDQLTGEDSGTWTGPGITSETDHNVNLQELFDTSGPGIYSFRYDVLAVPDNFICSNKYSIVFITLEKRLDFTGAKIEVAKDICESEISTATYSAKITQGPDKIPDGTYDVTYTVAGSISGSESIRGFFINGEMNFPISSSYFQQVGKFTINVTNIVSAYSQNSCVDIFNPFSTTLTIYPLPRLNGAVLTSTPTCQNKAGLMQLDAPQLLDGDYRITYNINGDNIATGQTAVIKAVGGKATFEVPGNLNVKSGLSVIIILNIVNITNPTPQCASPANVGGNLTINPLPNATTVNVAVNNYCLNDPVSVAISGLGNLTNAKISYQLSDSNTSTVQTITQAVTNGRIDFVIPAALLSNIGSTKITLLNLTNTVTSCDVNLTNVTDDFILYPLPAAPNVENQQFCKVDEATIANLAPIGTQFKWYNSPTATTPLANTLLLQSGNYYVRETSANGCVSGASMVIVTVSDSPLPVLNSDGQNFCGLKNPTIADLSNNTNVPSTVVWYDAPNAGNLLASSTLLTEQGRYYGFNFPDTGCFSSSYIEVTVTLTSCDDVPNDFFVPDGFSPNGDGTNDSFVIKDIEFLYPDYNLEIYNRYGIEMYRGDKNKPAWDGKNYEKSGIAGGIAPNGVYFYVLHFNKGNKKPQQGRLYLNR